MLMKRAQKSRFFVMLSIMLGAILCTVFFTIMSSNSDQSWRTASRAPVGLAPDPATTEEAVVQVYAARAVRWRGYVGVHSWLATKPHGADAFTVHEVNGWRLRRNGTAVVSSNRPPDGRWFGNAPELLAELRGEDAGIVIQQIDLDRPIEKPAHQSQYAVRHCGGCRCLIFKQLQYVTALYISQGRVTPCR